MKQNHKVRYYNLLTSDKLDSYFADIEEQAQNLFSRMVNYLTGEENVTEELKATDMMLWVRKMNNIRNRATEIVNEQVIYTKKKAQPTDKKSESGALIFCYKVLCRNLASKPFMDSLSELVALLRCLATASSVFG